ncbi:MAG: hypothetical protein ACLUOF_02595 [Ruminococcus sp.]
MKKLIAYYSRADENYFGGQRRYITEGNTEKAAKMELTGRSVSDEQKVPMRQIMTLHCTGEERFAGWRKTGAETLPDSLTNTRDHLGYPNNWEPCPWQCIHGALIFPERPSIRSAPMRAVD